MITFWGHQLEVTWSLIKATSWQEHDHFLRPIALASGTWVHVIGVWFRLFLMWISVQNRLKLNVIFFHISSQCCESGMFITDSNFSIPDPRVKKSPDPGSGSTTLNRQKIWMFLTQKVLLSSLKYDLVCWSQIRIFVYPDPGVKKSPVPESRIRNTVIQLGFLFSTVHLKYTYCIYVRTSALPPVLDPNLLQAKKLVLSQVHM